MAARVTLAVAVGCLMTAGLKVWLTFQLGGLTREQHDQLQILEGPLYEHVPHAGVNGCGPDRIDIRYADYYLYAPAPFCHDQLTLAARHGERSTVTPNQATYEIWMFGGSTILDIGVVDADTISFQLSARLNARVPAGVRVRNFGVPGFQSTQERTRFFEILRSESDPPDIAVFYLLRLGPGDQIHLQVVSDSAEPLKLRVSHGRPRDVELIRRGCRHHREPLRLSHFVGAQIERARQRHGVGWTLVRLSVGRPHPKRTGFDSRERQT